MQFFPVFTFLAVFFNGNPLLSVFSHYFNVLHCLDSCQEKVDLILSMTGVDHIGPKPPGPLDSNMTNNYWDKRAEILAIFCIQGAHGRFFAKKNWITNCFIGDVTVIFVISSFKIGQGHGRQSPYHRSSLGQLLPQSYPDAAVR